MYSTNFLSLLVMPITFGNKAVWPRGLCIAIGLFIATVVVIAACLTPLATRRYTEAYNGDATRVLATTTRIAPFRTCDNLNSVFVKDSADYCIDSVDYHARTASAGQSITINCDTYYRFIRSIQAFYVLTLLLVIAAFVLAVLNAFGVVNSLFVTLLIAIALLFSLIGFAVAFAVYRKKFEECFTASWFDRSDFNLGESAPLMLTAFLLLLCLLIVSVVMEKGPHDTIGQNRAAPAPVKQPVKPVAQPAPVIQQKPLASGPSAIFDL